MRLKGSIEIARPIDDVFCFVADPRNDPLWCERVRWCRQVRGDGPRAGARYEAKHRPSGYPWSHIRRIEVLELERPRFVRWSQVDHLATFLITYELAELDGRTRMTQADEIRWRLPGMGLIGRRIVSRHIGEQHSALKNALEAG